MNLTEFKYLVITQNIFGVHRVFQIKPHSQIFFSLRFKTKSNIQLIKECLGRTASLQKLFFDYRDVLITYVEKKLQQG